MIDTLARKQLVRRRRDGKDRRSVNIVLTEKGVDANRKVIPVLEEISRTVLHNIQDQQIEELSEVLRQIRKQLLAQIDRASSEE
jgi:DNA-binding MarR family transcriptional regulator